MSPSEPQKPRNKVNLRSSQAYRVRLDAFNTALEQVRLDPAVLRLKQEAQSVADTIDAETEALLQKKKALQARGVKLEKAWRDLHDALDSEHLRDLRSRCDELYAQCREAMMDREMHIRSQYPDLIHVYNVCEWTPPLDIPARNVVFFGQVAA